MDGAVGDICPRGRGIGEGSRRAGGRSKRGIVDCAGRDCGGGADRAVAGGRAKGQCAGKIERYVGAAFSPGAFLIFIIIALNFLLLLPSPSRSPSRIPPISYLLYPIYYTAAGVGGNPSIQSE